MPGEFQNSMQAHYASYLGWSVDTYLIKLIQLQLKKLSGQNEGKT